MKSILQKHPSGVQEACSTWDANDWLGSQRLLGVIRRWVGSGMVCIIGLDLSYTNDLLAVIK